MKDLAVLNIVGLDVTNHSNNETITYLNSKECQSVFIPCCPRCGEPLNLSDVEGYTFVCKNCDENFYGIEV